MNEPISLGLWFCAALLGGSLAAPQGCGDNQAVPEGKHISWDSPRMREIETQWQSLHDTYDKTPEKIPGEPGKTKYGRLAQLEDRLFTKRLSDPELSQLAGSIGATPGRGFVNRLAEFMARVFIDSGDRDSLVRLLSTRCPGRVGAYADIEFYLAFRGGKLKDPILILGEAYSKCQVPETRHDLAAASRRGFAGLGIGGKDDADYVKNATHWYEKEKDHLVVNRNYWRNEMRIPLECYEVDPKLYDEFPSDIKRELLFEKVAPPRGSPRHSPESGRTDSQAIHDGAERASATDTGTEEEEWAKLEGTWEVLEVREDDGPTPPEKIRGIKFVFHKNVLTVTSPDDRKDEEFRVRLGPRQRPRAIDLLRMSEDALEREQTTALVYELQQETTPAIYGLKGDTLRFGLPLYGARQRPTSFNAEQGSRESSYLLKRVKE